MYLYSKNIPTDFLPKDGITLSARRCFFSLSLSATIQKFSSFISRLIKSGDLNKADWFFVTLAWGSDRTLSASDQRRTSIAHRTLIEVVRPVPHTKGWRRQLTGNMDSEKLLTLEIGIIVFLLAVGVFMMYLYVRLTPPVEVPEEFYFKNRESKVRERREKERLAKKKKKEQEVFVQ